jgi:hypothetical protein
MNRLNPDTDTGGEFVGKRQQRSGDGRRGITSACAMEPLRSVRELTPLIADDLVSLVLTHGDNRNEFLNLFL